MQQNLIQTFDPLKPFELLTLPPAKVDLNSPKFTKLLIQARAEMAELKGYSEGLPNPLILLSPAVIKDALASSEIENIVTTMMDVLQNQVIEEDEQKAPDKEVLRYREAVMYAFNELKNGTPISTRLIQGIQGKLMPDYKMIGFRKQQNRLHNPITKEVVYTPPEAQNISRLISDLENFANDDNSAVDPLIKNAILHYQFEAIHPFGDGNGRTGRILMVLMLVQDHLLEYPILFISGYLNRNKTEYYEKLLNVSSKGEWEQFIIFILEGFYVQAKETKELMLEIRNAFFEFKRNLKKELPKVYSTELVEKLFAYPVVTPVRLGRELGVHYTTASRYLKALKEKEFLENVEVGKYQMYLNSSLMDILYKR